MIQTFKNDHYNPLHFLGICFLDQLRKNRCLLRSIVISQKSVSIDRVFNIIWYYQNKFINLKKIYSNERKLYKENNRKLYKDDK